MLVFVLLLVCLSLCLCVCATASVCAFSIVCVLLLVFMLMLVFVLMLVFMLYASVFMLYASVFMLMLVCYAYASVFVPLQLLLGSAWWLSRCLAGQVSHLHTVEYTTKCLTSRAFSNNLRHCHHYHLLLLRRNYHRCHQRP